MSGFEMGAIWDGLEPTHTKTAHTRNLNGDLAALNASMYGYGGHGAYIPMPPPQRPEQFAFWDQQKINETVTRKYVTEHIGGGKADNATLRRRLDAPMSFGDGLTESTYVEWILERARTFYLVLLELGVPEKIFDIVDGSWDDDDLPIDAEEVWELGLDNATLEKRFLKKQHMFRLRLIGAGDHVDYSEDETVAIECASTKRQMNVNMNVSVNIQMGISGLNAPAVVTVDKVYFPRKREEFYMRMQVPLGDGDDGRTIQREIFMEEIAASKAVLHRHIVNIHASYTHQDDGYILLSPACELNLSQFIKYTPYTFKSMPKDRRRRVLLEWLHCLADALAYMYEKGAAHRDIRPRAIVIDQTNNNILFADIGNFKRLNPVNKSLHHDVDVEAYEYAAPELWQRAITPFGGSSVMNTAIAGRAYRKDPASNSSSTGSTASIGTAYTGPWPGGDTGAPISPTQSHSTGSFGSFHAGHVGLSQWVAAPDNPSKADVFSLGCIFLDIITFLLKRRSSAFIAHRYKKQRRPRQSATPDQSFHANLSQVEIWIDELEREVDRKQDLTVLRVLRLIRSMLDRDPNDRPHPHQVSHALYKMLEEEFVLGQSPAGKRSSTSTGGEGSLHCEPTCDSPVSELKLWPTSATQRTCASSSSSGSSSGSVAVKSSGECSWEEDIIEGEDPNGAGRLWAAQTPCLDVNENTGESLEKPKRLGMKRSMVRLFGFAK